ncbi:MAG: glutamine-hydrolyzing carbamoyl-phosphate synthase small subunit [Opitutales bacterium]|nr:glutamine-hydrolyzing carbamoyl-phosphate synthase small subunit [Opitutales bacterium]
MMCPSQSGILALEDGSVFRGIAFGACKTVVGEAVFNTSMTGYQEILTDPSYYGQIVTMTASQIGNYGINAQDLESDKVQVTAFVVRELSPVASNWRSEKPLSQFLQENDIPGLSGVDTRTITKKLRLAGVMKACVSTEGISDEEAVERARNWTGLVGVDYVKEVTSASPWKWSAESDENTPFSVPGMERFCDRRIPRDRRYHVVALDFGAKRSIFRNLSRHGFDVTVVPADTSREEIEALQPDGIFLSNGPGDPEPILYAQKTVAELMPKYPVFGICFGHQIITHALGASTFKLKFGHRGGNQPVKNVETGKVMITAQNHGFASDPDSLLKTDAVVTEVNMNDNTIAGLRHRHYPVFSVQYHPEAAPGPNDAVPHFETFYQNVKAFVDAREAGESKSA